MATIYAFPDSATEPALEPAVPVWDSPLGDASVGENRAGRLADREDASHRVRRPSVPSRPADVPDEVWSAVMSVVAMPRQRWMAYHEIPVPASLADYGVGVSLRCVPLRCTDGERDGEGVDDVAADRMGNIDVMGGMSTVHGWLMAMFCRRPQDGWQGHWRCVAYLRFPMDVSQPTELTVAMSWDEMQGELKRAGARDIVGTVSVIKDTGFGVELAHASGGCEIRVSWTPQMADTGEGPDVGAQIESWTRFMHAVADDEEGAAVGR